MMTMGHISCFSYQVHLQSDSRILILTKFCYGVLNSEAEEPLPQTHISSMEQSPYYRKRRFPCSQYSGPSLFPEPK
jgi:hypothetical protein